MYKCDARGVLFYAHGTGTTFIAHTRTEKLPPRFPPTQISVQSNVIFSFNAALSHRQQCLLKPDTLVLYIRGGGEIIFMCGLKMGSFSVDSAQACIIMTNLQASCY